MASRVAKGPNSSTTMRAGVLPSPRTRIVSLIREPGRTTSSDTTVVTDGVAETSVVSVASPHAVVTAGYAAVAKMDSR